MKKLIPICLFLCCSYLANTQALKEPYPVSNHDFQYSILDKQQKFIDSMGSMSSERRVVMSPEDIEIYKHLLGKKESLKPLSEVYQVEEDAKIAKEKLQADMTSFLLDDLYIAQKDGKYGLFNKNLKPIVAYSYDFIGIPSDGLIPVQKGNQFGYINYKGKLIIPLQFEEASYFVGGTAKVWTKEYCQIINTKGTVLAQSKEALVWYEGEIYFFKKGYTKNGRTVTEAYYITNKYVEVIGGIPFDYYKYDANASFFKKEDAIKPVFEHVFLVYNTLLVDANMRVIGLVGKLNSSSFERRIAKDETTNLELCLTQGRFDKTKQFYSYWGTEFKPDRPVFDKIKYLTKDIGIGRLGEEAYLLGKDKKPLFKDPFDDYTWYYSQERDSIASNCLFVQKNNKWAVYNLERQLYDFEFHSIKYLTGAYFSASLSNSPSEYRVYHLIDGLFSEMSFEEITYYEEEQGYKIIKEGQMASILELEDLKKGIDDLPWKYVSKWLPIEGMVLVKNPATKKFGYLNSENDLVIPFLYNAGLPFKDGIAKVMKGKRLAYIDKKGKVLVESSSPFLKRLGSKYIRERIVDKRKKKNTLVIWNQNQEKVYEGDFVQCQSILGDLVVLEKFELNDRGYPDVFSTGLYDLQQQQFILASTPLLTIDIEEDYIDVKRFPSLEEAEELVQKMKKEGVLFSDKPIRPGSFFHYRMDDRIKFLDVLDLDKTKAEELVEKYDLILRSDSKFFLEIPNLLQYYDKDGKLLEKQPRYKPTQRKKDKSLAIKFYEEELMELNVIGDSALTTKVGCKTKDGKLLFLPAFDEIGSWKDGMALAVNQVHNLEQESYILYSNGNKEKLPYKLKSSLVRYGNYTVVRINHHYYFLNLKTKELYAEIPYLFGFLDDKEHVLNYYTPERRWDSNEKERTFKFNDDFEIVEEDSFIDPN